MRAPWSLMVVMASCSALPPPPDGGVDAGHLEDAGTPADAGRSARLLFESLDARGEATLWHAPLDAGPVRLPGAFHGVRPSAEPRGTTVLFNAADPMDVLGTPVVWALDGESGAARLLSPDLSAVELEASFSPDGTAVLLTSQRDDPSGDIVWAAWRDGGLEARRNLTPSMSVPDRTPAWSRDGQRVAFTSYRSGQPRLWVMNVDGGDARQVTPQPGSWGDFSPDWSADDTLLVFHRVEGAGPTVNTRLGFVSSAGGEVTLWERPGRRTFDARFSPDGTLLAAWERSDAGDDVVVLSLDGGVLRVIDLGGAERHPSWR